RDGDTWTQSYSEDGANWQTLTTFTHAMVVNAVGVFAGNAGPAPAHTAVVDYVFNLSSPIDAEDGEMFHSLTATTSGNGAVTADPAKPAYGLGETVQLTATPASGWSFDGWSGAVSGSENPIEVVIAGDMSVEAGFTE